MKYMKEVLPMLKEIDLRNSPYYYRLADKIDKEGYVGRITIEDRLLTNEFKQFLYANGYAIDTAEKGQYTTCFKPKK